MNLSKLKSWIEVKHGSDFPIQNIPFGIYSHNNSETRAATIIGDIVIDLHELHLAGKFQGIDLPKEVFKKSFLNDFISCGKEITGKVRLRIAELFSEGNNEIADDASLKTKALFQVQQVKLHLPVHIGDYTDFYSSIDHATNVGKMFRDPANALLPNWKHLPVGYHGRASSIMVSGHTFFRPKGQTKPADAELPVFGPSKLLDFELETGFIIGKNTANGESVSTEKADDFIFGMVLVNDWSARDIQTWEYVPLGPFLAKNFATTISPWVVTLEALEPFRVKGYTQEPEVLHYLKYSGDKNIDIKLEVYIKPPSGTETRICTSNYKYMYWTMEQQLAHHTVNGCNIQVGDMMASGTISGPTESEFGSMLELTWRGTKPLKLNDGTERKFINDNDTVIMRGYCEKDGIRIGFGDCASTVLPAR